MKLPEDDAAISEAVTFFASYEIHKSHGRSIDPAMARDFLRNVSFLDENSMDETQDLPGLVRSLYNQYELWFDKTPFFKMFENGHGINWGR